MSCLDELKHLFVARTKCIWIKTHEEVLVIEKIKEYLLRNGLPYDVKSWSMYSGLQVEPLLKTDEKPTPDKSIASIDRLIATIDAEQSDANRKTCVYILKDLHLMLETKSVIRGIRDLKEKPGNELKSYQPIIVVSPVLNIPVEHEKLFTVLEFDTPSKEEISRMVNGFARKISASAAEKGYTVATPEVIQECINLAVGLTKNEIVSFMAKSLSKYKTLNPDIFYEARLNLINKTGLLELVNANISIDDMGGNHIFKDWIEDVKLSMTPEAADFGVERSKGYVGIGIPGTSKTLSAEMIATELNLPLLKFNVTKVMSSLVGRSEQNMEAALNVVKACAPCVLLIDEVEKSLSGMQSSARTDGGTMARVIGSMLQFLSSDKSSDVFTVMTSNDISQMPPELTRSGRLDTIWYFGLPTEEERKEIWRIHFGKTPMCVTEELLNYASANSENLTGAEIKEAVKVSMRKAYKRFMQDGNRTITEEDVLSAIGEIVPVYNASKERIIALERYAETRARFASEKTRQSINAPLLNIDDLKKKK